MKNIGKYNGIPCFTCEKEEYVSVFKKGSDDGRQIFIIDGTMVRNNKIVGYYDGNHVKDVYNDEIYYKTPKRFTYEDMLSKTADEKSETAVKETSSTTGPENKEINFADYTSVVDEFFKSLRV